MNMNCARLVKKVDQRLSDFTIAASRNPGKTFFNNPEPSTEKIATMFSRHIFHDIPHIRLLSVLNHGLRFHPAFVKMRAAVRPGGGSVVGPREATQ